MRAPTPSFLLAATAALLLTATDAAAQFLPRLGVSAAPDRYVSYLQADVGVQFRLYVIALGTEDDPALPFALEQVDWAVFTACCGDSPVQITGVTYPEGMDHEGDPYFALRSSAVGGCADDPVVLLATLTFDWVLSGANSFPVSAGAMSPARDCAGGEHLLEGTYVQIQGRGGQVPAATPGWGRIKNLYR